MSHEDYIGYILWFLIIESGRNSNKTGRIIYDSLNFFIEIEFSVSILIESTVGERTLISKNFFRFVFEFGERGNFIA